MKDEAASDGDNNDTQKRDDDGGGDNSKLGNSSEGQSKPKRQMKTPFQLENLEKAYALEMYPSEAVRAELSEKLGLTDRQLQMWFCHRRLKDKKDLPPKKPLKAPPLLASPTDDPRLGPEPGNDYGSGSGSGSSPPTRSELRNVVPVRAVPGYYESPQTIMELRAIACVEAQLGEPLREDGPILGVEFDPLPPDAFGAPIAVAEQQKRPNLAYDSKIYDRHDVRTNKAPFQAIARTFPEYSFLPTHQPGIRSDAFGQLSQPHLYSPMEGPTRTPSFPPGNEHIPRIHATQSHSSRVKEEHDAYTQSQSSRVRLSSPQEKQGISYPSPPRDSNVAPKREPLTNTADTGMNSNFSDHPIVGQENPGGEVSHNDSILRMEKKRKADDTKGSRDVEASEMKTRKELEKQDNLRRKNEERLRKEMEKQDRERRKEEERLMRERQREEERSKREQRREVERKEKFLLKESLRAEKRRQKEELRKEKEAERRKAALEKANARRIAKESMELIEDEQLELMELAAASKGFSSIIHIDLNTLQNLESFRDSLCVFPPTSVKLKKPFAVQPWSNSEQNVGNLLMAWRFLITFADVLELWPFTLDEFVQAFHDYDSRLLGEVHVALLKVIIKDIEDVARTPSTGLGTNQNGAANPGGGHPEIVEGAYAWGFDIRNWQKNLNQLTWPEIFRQLGLSAGFGPQLKKRSITWSYANDKDEGRNSEDIISKLRNGSAAESAVAKMQEKGLLAPRRSRHRLTPGTVKFAAFHVLSLEGSKGLTVLELAEKIQKSGLRDLTTSKTPEASISVALTRDTKLFERIAPSTYRVRSTFRKDPADSESILSEARKKIQIFENGFLAGEDADDVEREEESESDEADEDLEDGDLVIPSSANQKSEQYDDTNICPSNGKENLGHDVDLIQNEFETDLPCFPENGSKGADCPSSVTGQPIASEGLNTGNLDEDNMEIDESKLGESWVQGLTDGEYSDLAVEERLNALVALIGLANEGNSIRVVLEDRLEAANALKKQMWAEAQTDKVRLKDDNISKSDFASHIGNKVEAQYTYPAVESNQSPLLDINNNNINNEASPGTADKQKGASIAQSLPIEKSSLVQDFCPGTGPDNPQIQVPVQCSKRSRSQLKSYIAHKAEETCVYRSLPLGQDRRRNRYWQFAASASSNDPGSGRIFVEQHDGNWRLIDSGEAFDNLLTSLDSRGIRESHLHLMLQKIEKSFKENVLKNTPIIGSSDEVSIEKEARETHLIPDRHDSSSSALHGLNPDISETSLSFKIELAKSESEKKAALRRYQDFQKWMWKECYNSSILCATKYGIKRCKALVDICDICLDPYFVEDPHCNSCHRTFSSNIGFNFSKHAFQCGDKLSKDICILENSLPLRTRLLKVLLACMEASVLSEGFGTNWTNDMRKQWGVKLSKSSSVEELWQILVIFERALRRDFLSSNFSTTDELLGSTSISQSSAHTTTDPESVAVLPWVPQTTAALSLRLFEFDSSISYVKLEKVEPCEEKDGNVCTKLPLRYTPFKSSREIEPAEFDSVELPRDKSAPNKIARGGYKRGRGTSDHGRGKKLAKRMYNSKRGTGRRNAVVTDNLSQKLKHLGRTQGQSGGRGRRTVRKRRVEKRAVEDLLLGHTAASHSSKSGRELLRSLDEEWDGEKASPMTPVHIGVPEISNSAEEVESDENAQEVESDENAQAVEYDQGNWEISYNGVHPNRWIREDLVGMSDEDVDAFEDDNENDNVIEQNEEEEDLEGDVMSDDGSDGMANRVANGGVSDSEDSSD